MRVSQLYERIESGSQLAQAFTANQWRRIANHFITTSGAYGQSMGTTVNSINGMMTIFNREVGSGTTDGETPVSWNAKAQRYGMSMSRPPMSWDAIYNHLLPHAENPANDIQGAEGDVLPSSINTRAPNTRDTSSEIINWYPYEGDRFTSRQQYNTWISGWFDNGYKANRPQTVSASDSEKGIVDIFRWLGSRDSNGQRNNAAWLTLTEVNRNMISRIESGTDGAGLPREEAYNQIVAWVRSTDTLYNRYVQEMRSRPAPAPAQ